MKIAYMFSGHARTWKQTYENFFKNIFSVAPGDIFMHTWDISSSITASHWNGYSNLTPDHLKIATIPVDINALYNAYNPKILMVEKDPGPNLSLIRSQEQSNVESPAHAGVQNYLNGTRRIFEILSKYDNYDRVFHLRPDIDFTVKLKIEELISGNYYVPNYGCWDLWGFGTVEHFDIKTNFCHYLKQYWYDQGCTGGAIYEDALLKYLTERGVKRTFTSLTSTTIRPF